MRCVFTLLMTLSNGSGLQVFSGCVCSALEVRSVSRVARSSRPKLKSRATTRTSMPSKVSQTTLSSQPCGMLRRRNRSCPKWKPVLLGPLDARSASPWVHDLLWCDAHFCTVVSPLGGPWVVLEIGNDSSRCRGSP